MKILENLSKADTSTRRTLKLVSRGVLLEKFYCNHFDRSKDSSNYLIFSVHDSRIQLKSLILPPETHTGNHSLRKTYLLIEASELIRMLLDG